MTMAFLRKRIRTLVCLAITTAAGFGLWHYYDGWARIWFRHFIPDAIYVIFWSLAAFLFWPRKTAVLKIPVAVFIATCVLEFLQLWKPAFLQQLRGTLIGAAVLGTDFLWVQFPFYVLGAVVSVFLLAALARDE